MFTVLLNTCVIDISDKNKTDNDVIARNNVPDQQKKL